MLIAISSSNQDINAELDPRFGRARYFHIVDENGAGGSFYDNPHRDGKHGAGIRAAEFVVGLGAEVIISGDVGPKAMDVLKGADCKCFAAKECTVAEALAAWKNKSLTAL